MNFSNLFSHKKHSSLFSYRRKKHPDHFFWKIAGGAALALVGAGVIRSLPDIKRYIRISTM